MAAAELVAGKRVLIVEDETLVALLIEVMLEDAGAIVVGHCATVDQALAVARHTALDLAVLDINLHGELSFPVAEALEQRRIPFLFVTGYGSQIKLPDPTWAVCSKPFRSEDLLARLAQAVALSPAL